jgi:hypothetical protein
MKKHLVIMGLALFTLGSGGFIYQTYAAAGEKTQAEAQVETNSTQGEQVPAEIPATQIGEPAPGAVDISEVPADKIFVPRSVHVPNVANAKTADTLKETGIFARNTEYGLLLRTTYYSPSGAEIVFTQGPVTEDEDGTIQSLKNSYKLENVEVTEINGHTVVYVDGVKRKVVHLITKDHLFSVSTLNGTLDDLKNIAEQIQE